MELNQIREGVARAIQTWQEIRVRLPRPLKVSPGGEETLGYMIQMIDRDPSQRWVKFDADAVQRYAVSVIPNVLNDIVRRNFHFRNGEVAVVTSWEIWHGISDVLDQFCPIPKKD